MLDTRNLHKVGLVLMETPPDSPLIKLAKLLDKYDPNTNGVKAGAKFETADIDTLALWLATLYYGHYDLGGTPRYDQTTQDEIRQMKEKLTPVLTPWVGKPLDQVPLTNEWNDILVKGTTLQPSALKQLVDVFTTIAKPISDVGKAVVDMATGFGNVLGVLTDPQSWIRFGALALGLILIVKALQDMQ